MADQWVDLLDNANQKPQPNLAGTRIPIATDDDSQGYATGSRWTDTTNHKDYVCTDASTGAANWIETTGAGGSGSSTWIGLTDTDPSTFSGQAGKAVLVNTGETGLEFGSNLGTAAEIEAVVSHDNLQNVNPDEHIDWTQDQGATNIEPLNVPEVTAVAAGLAPASGGGTTNYLRADGLWQSPPAAGAEVNDLTSAVTWDDVPDANITETSVTQHEAAINHDALTNTGGNAHIDWELASQGTIHATNYTVSAADAEQVVIDARSSSGTITAGQAVFITGWDIGAGFITVELSQSDSSGTMPSYGIAKSTIGTSTTGQVVVSGELTGIDTTGIEGTSPASAKPVYISAATAGALTVDKPTGANLIQKVGIINRIHGSQGAIQVVGAGRSNDVPNIADGKVWMGDGSGVATETALSLDTMVNITSSDNDVNVPIADPIILRDNAADLSPLTVIKTGAVAGTSVITVEHPASNEGISVEQTSSGLKTIVSPLGIIHDGDATPAGYANGPAEPTTGDTDGRNNTYGAGPATGTADGGDLTLNAGRAPGAGTHGVINVGTNNLYTASINVGHASVPTTVVGDLNVTGDLDITGATTGIEGASIEATAITDGFVLTADGAGAAAWEVATAGGSPITVQDEGTPLTVAVTRFNFVGAGVTVTEDVTDQVTVTVPLSTAPVSTVFGRTDDIVGAASDYDASQIDNDSSVTGAFVDDALNTLGTHAALVEEHLDWTADQGATNIDPANVPVVTASADGLAPTFPDNTTDYLRGDGTWASPAGSTEVNDLTAVVTWANVPDANVTESSVTQHTAAVVTTAAVTTAGAVMDSEVDADIKTLALPASTTISPFGATLVDDLNEGAARTTLGAASLSTTITAGTGLTGGGSLAANRTINIDTGGVDTTQLADDAVTVDKVDATGITDGYSLTASSGSTVWAQAALSGSIDAGQVTTGTLDNARVTGGNVTQHEALISHDALLNFDADEHYPILNTTQASRPAASSHNNKMHVSTDTDVLVRSDGASWNAVTTTTADADALNSATTTVNVSAATAPATGQVLTATGSTAATWQAAAPGAIGLGTWTMDAANQVPASGQVAFLSLTKSSASWIRAHDTATEGYPDILMLGEEAVAAGDYLFVQKTDEPFAQNALFIVTGSFAHGSGYTQWTITEESSQGDAAFTETDTYAITVIKREPAATGQSVIYEWDVSSTSTVDAYTVATAGIILASSGFTASTPYLITLSGQIEWATTSGTADTHETVSLLIGDNSYASRVDGTEVSFDLDSGDKAGFSMQWVLTSMTNTNITLHAKCSKTAATTNTVTATAMTLTAIVSPTFST